MAKRETSLISPSSLSSSFSLFKRKITSKVDDVRGETFCGEMRKGVGNLGAFLWEYFENCGGF